MLSVQGVDMSETTEDETTKIGAKVQSRCAMIFSGLWIAVLTIMKGLGKCNLEVTDIIYSGVAITAVWTPTFLSIFLDKLKDISFGGHK